MTKATDFIAELVRAANEVEKLSSGEGRRLVDRAARTVREMRIETGIRQSPGKADALREIETAALLAEANGSDVEFKGLLLDLADMMRTLKIVLDGKDEILRGE